MKFKTQILLATFVMLLVPLGALATLFLARNGGTVPGPVLMRYIYLTNWINLNIHQGQDGRPQLNIKKVPLGMSDLVVLDNAGALVTGIVNGVLDGPSVISTAGTVALLSHTQGKRFFWQSLTHKGQIYGSVLATFSLPRPVNDESLEPFDWLNAYALALLCTAVLLGLWLSRVSLQVSRLRVATDQLIRGSWETAVTLHGIGTIEFRDLAQKMENLRQALVSEQQKRTRFLASVSHDLKTPLASIQGYVDAIDDGMAEDTETLQRYLAIIRRKGQLLDQRLSDLLDWGRIEAKDWQPHREKQDFGSFLTNLCQSLAEDAELLGLTLKTVIPPQGRYWLFFDEVLITRALENVVNNAFKYSHSAGTVQITWEVLEREFQVAVEDHGPGIRDEDRPLVFEPFFRGTGAPASSRGLGLYIARTIFAAHGWQIELDTDWQSGARFKIRIPFDGSVAGGQPPTVGRVAESNR